jgi:hypothetical protein
LGASARSSRRRRTVSTSRHRLDLLDQRAADGFQASHFELAFRAERDVGRDQNRRGFAKASRRIIHE